ncbi:ExeA family protein [Vibrio sp. TRT 21S02]|uniref:ExeA family protein n=1 Tax=Vibrio sp. TRT 21S02 TaxID=3418507 RepID=UPI003CF39FEF
MYKEFFGFVEQPFSIVPSSRYLYLSQRHQEAINHLNSGLGEGGGFAMLSGEVGTGKTTVARAMLKSLDAQTQAGFILNPTFSSLELLQAICDEFEIEYVESATLKQLSQAIYQFLLANHANGMQTLLVIDEAQHLAADVLEQLRLLTNLETDSRKLLKVLLIGQPELQQKLQMPQLRQLAQRITGRYHLLPLTLEESAKYIQFRLDTAGGDVHLFDAKSLKCIAAHTHGIPRLINLACDAALRGAYQNGEKKPSYATVQYACSEVMSFQGAVYQPATRQNVRFPTVNLALPVSLLIGLGLAWGAYVMAPAIAEPYIDAQLASKYPQVESVEHRKEVFPDVVNVLLARSGVLDAEIRELYKVWGYQASPFDSTCSESESSLFRCEARHGAIQDIQNLGLPVVLTLSVDNNRSYAVLYKFDGDKMQLLADGQRVELESRWLRKIWNGEYHFIWQRSWDQMLKSGMKGESVRLLDQRLSQLLGESETETDEFGIGLKRKVELFQKWQGLETDGIAGKRTLEKLELMTQQNAPSLSLEEESRS